MQRQDLSESVIRWLLDGDPAIRWQVMRDLTRESDDAVARERTRIAREGWGAQLLDRQRRDGTWGDGVAAPQWQSTLCAMVLLQDWAWIRRATGLALRWAWSGSG